MREQPNAADTINYLRKVVEPGTVVEIRILGCVDNPKYPKYTVSGYFDQDHLNELAQLLAKGIGPPKECMSSSTSRSPTCWPVLPTG